MNTSGLLCTWVTCWLVLVLSSPTFSQPTTKLARPLPGPGVTMGNSKDTSLSSDGRYVAFQSDDCNLVDGDTNHVVDVFVHDRQTGATTRASVDSAGIQGNKDSIGPSISADGRFVAFESSATNLVPDDTNGLSDIFVHDLLSRTTTRVSVDSNGVEGNPGGLGSSRPSISGDGRYVTFDSAAKLVPDDTNRVGDIFVHDLLSRNTTRVSLDSLGGEANDGSWESAISSDGRYVSFASDASNLVLGDSNDAADIFVRDLATGSTTRVSLDSAGNEADYGSNKPSISAWGRFISFESTATNLVPGDTNNRSDVFVHDRMTGATVRVSVDSNGMEGNSFSRDASISSDGRYVTFASSASNLVPGDNNGMQDVFIHDLQTGTLERISVSTGGAEGNSDSGYASISADGRAVALSSSATNFVSPPFLDGYRRTYVREVSSHTTHWVSEGRPGLVNGNSYWSSLSADGRFVAFSSSATNLVPGDANGHASDIIVLDRSTRTYALASLFDSGQASDGSTSPSISDDGRLVAFVLAISDWGYPYYDIFVRDLQASVTEQINVDSSGGDGNGSSDEPSISADGRYVAFDSTATNLVPGDSSNGDIFVRDRLMKMTTSISVDPSGGPANGHSRRPSISADGRYVAFESTASNLVPGDTNEVQDIFVRDRQLGVTFRVSVDSNGIEANRESFRASTSRDGRWVAFDSWATNLVLGDTNERGDVFIHDRQSGITSRASVDSNGQESDGSSRDCALSPDGRYVVFLGPTNLVPGDTNAWADLFLHDGQTGETTRVNVSSLGEQANRQTGPASIAEHARFIAFSSSATNLVPEDASFTGCLPAQVFLRDRIALRFNGTPSHRNPVNFTISNAHSETGYQALVLLSRSGTDGIQLPNDGRQVFLTLDAWTNLGLQFPTLLSGTIDASGIAHTPLVPFPQTSAGLTVHAAAVNIDWSQGKFGGVTAPISFVTQ